MIRRLPFLAFFIPLLACWNPTASGQPAWTIDLLGKTEQKPEKFENRKLGSERLAEKKFTIVRRFFQNTYTHYNYFYNASNKIAQVIERAKSQQKDDYGKLLAFYPYSLEQTKAQAIELDSVIFKSTAGILLHDLRSNWVDNMYLLMGQAYFLRKDFDSAAATFQFINYNLYPRKKGEDDDQVVGTGYSAKNQQVSIANSEKAGLVTRLTSRPPSRNDALLWLARTLIEQQEMGEAIGLINTLQQDPNLPKRLQNDLNELHAYWFYQQGMLDSTAHYLSQALTNADTKQDRSRSEFLLGQIYGQLGKYDQATTFYEKASKHTVDPLMDIYARLNSATLLRGTNPKEMDKAIDNLVKMAKRDKFESYRHILYFAAGEIALEKPDTLNAVGFYNRSLKFNVEQPIYKNKALLKLADIYYDQKAYKLAFAAYDSLASDDTTLTAQLASIQSRRNALSNLVQRLTVVEREDSLQQIAALPTAEREAFVRKLSKKLRKERGLKAEEPSSGAVEMLPIGGPGRETQAPADLFGSSSKGEWYFYNNQLRSKGFNEFKRRWGTRTNTDNWRRKSATESAAKTENNNAAPPSAPDMGVGSPDEETPIGSNNPDAPVATRTPQKKTQPEEKASGEQPEDVSFEGLMSNLPLTPERLAESQQKLAINLYESGKVYQFELTDYEEAIQAYESSLRRFPDSLYEGELYFNLYSCYQKLGRQAEANKYKQRLEQSFPDAKATKLATNPTSVKPGNPNDPGTKAYEQIYTLFIEGKFDEALSQKRQADSLYGNNYWNPQLLYIEAVYHIRQRNDSIAKIVLRNIIDLYPDAKIKPKAERMIEVLRRRAEIEKYLTELDITRAKEDETIVVNSRPSPTPPTQERPRAITDTVSAVITPQAPAPTEVQAPAAPAPILSGPFVFEEGPQWVIMLLDKVDGTYINEAKNAYTRFSSDYFRELNLEITREAIDAEKALVVFKSFPDAATALRFVARARRAAPEEVSWLPASKYSFLVISERNLELLKSNKNLAGYLEGLRKQFPNQF